MYFDKAPECVFKEAYCRHAAPPTECQNILLIQSSCAKRDFNLCYVCSLFQQHHWLFFTRCLLPLGLPLMQCFQRLCVQNVLTMEPGNILSAQLCSGRWSHSDLTQ